MTTQMAPLEEPPRPRAQGRPLSDLSVKGLAKAVPETVCLARRQHSALQSLVLVNGLEPLADVCRRYDVQLSAQGSVVRRLVQEPHESVFDAARYFLSDLDLVHTGPAARTAEIKAAILTEVPFGETLRLQLRSEAEDEPFRTAAAYSGIIPASTLRLSTDGGLHDPWSGVQDIVYRRYRYIKNGFFKDSPLYRAGRDLDVCSALLYFRIIVESEGVSLKQQPGLDDALRVIDETVSSGEALDMVRRNPELCARLVSLLFGLKGASPKTMDTNHSGYALLGLDRLAEYFSEYAVLREVFDNVFRPLPVGASLVASAHLAGAQFRFEFSPQELWMYDPGRIWDQLFSAVNAFRGSAEASPEPALPTIDKGLVAVAASPTLRMSGGRSPSSGSADGPAGVHEFVDFMANVEPEYELPRTTGPDDLSVIVVVSEKDDVRWVTTVPSYCAAGTDGDETYLFVRCNLGGIGEAVNNGALQVFVLGWAGRDSALRRV